MPKLTIVAHIVAAANQIHLVKAELEKLVAPTQAEMGCLQYDLHQDNDNPVHFLFYENWESRELWQRHMSAAHIQAYGAATSGAIESFKLHEMSVID